MAAKGSNVAESLVLKEHEPLTELLSQIPHKVQRGLKTGHEHLELTCIDVNQHFLALGSHIGTVFLYDRDKHTLQRLRSEDPTVSARCVALHHGLDDLVAIGYSSGTIYIFQLPSMLMGHSKKLERFVVEDLHQTSLSCLAWSTNGMKLYSGDLKGCVGSTEVDFIEGKCKSSPLLIESNTEIVQLDQGHRSLLVSTKHRCIVCRMDDKDRIVQIGSKDRKITGDFGACFIPAMCKPDAAQLFATRPGFRVWKASINGTVNNTFIYKELLSQPHPQIPLLDFVVTNIETGQRSNQFGHIKRYGTNQVVTWNESGVFVLDVEKTALVGSQSHIGRIKAVVVSEEEIFVLRADTDRNVVRIAHKPLPASGYQLLKQLQEERREADLHLKVKEPEKEEPEKVSSADSDKVQEKSPFKVLQGNFMDKVKIIAKPTALKEKIQEKLGVNHRKETPSKYSQQYVFEADVKSSQREHSPPGLLPPVVRLDSPDLITVEISEPSSDFKMQKVPSSERFSALSGDSPLLDNEICNNDNQSTPSKTGSGASSALARLQEDHKLEESSEPAFRVSETSEDQPVIITQQPEDEGGIVFARKAKQKKKKKGRERKSRISDIAGEKDQDSVSIHSTTSVTSADSYHSEHSSPARHSADTVDDDDGATGTVADEDDTQQDIPKGSTGDKVIEEKCNSDVMDGSDTVSVVQDEHLDERESEVPETKVDKITTEEHSVVVEVKGVSDIKHVVESNQETIKVKETAPTIGISEPVEMPGPVETPGSIYDQYLVSPDTGASNLDIEMAKLDSFLAETSDTSGTELERSTSVASSYKSSLSLDTGQDTFLSSFDNQKQDFSRSGKSVNLESQLEQLDIEAMSNFEQTDHPLQELKSLNSISSISSLSKQPSLDFYTKYASKSPGEMSLECEDAFSVDNVLEEANTESKTAAMDDELNELQVSDRTHFLKTVNNWTEVPAFGNIHSLSVSNMHIWITDKSCNIYYSTLRGPGLNWKKALGNASQISVSLCGNILWCLHKNTVLAGTKITQKRPEGMKWVEAVKDVAYICVDQTCAWYIKTNHEVMIQKNLSRERPCYTGYVVESLHKLKLIACRAGVVWALTDSCKWLYRSGVTPSTPEGKEWRSGDSGSENRLFNHLSLGDNNFGWAIDVVGQVWFCSGVTMETPRGDGKWWQVPLSGEYFMKDPSTLDLLKSFSKQFDPQKLAQLLTSQSGGLVSGSSGVWVCPDCTHVLHMCRGNIEGQLWEETHPESLTSTTAWKTISCGNAVNDKGLIWGQQPSGDLFAFTADRKMCSNIEAPLTKGHHQLFVCMSACPDALWGLTCDGEIFIRTGMSSLEQKGNGWCKLDLSQIEDSHLVHISCSKLNVWAVDSDGLVFHRIGVKAPNDHSLNAAWLPVDNGGTVFTQIVAGSQDWKVWAVDNRRQVYVRTGITAEMPIGRQWTHVSGTLAMQLSMSSSFVWALNHSGELLCRHGVSENNITGDYWKKLPGFLTCISAAPSNSLWGINKDGQLVRRRTRYIVKETAPSNTGGRREGGARGIRQDSEDGDWELV